MFPFGATRRICKEQSDGIASLRASPRPRPIKIEREVGGSKKEKGNTKCFLLELLGGFEPPTSSLPRTRSTD